MLKQEGAKYYNHAENCTNTAEGYAVFMAAKSAKLDGMAYKVYFRWSKAKPTHFWEGSRYDCIQLARSIAHNKGEVNLIGPGGEVTETEECKGLKY